MHRYLTLFLLFATAPVAGPLAAREAWPWRVRRTGTSIDDDFIQ